MAQQGTIRGLEISMLRLTKNHTPFADGVACVQAYWSYAMDLPQGERIIMRRLILDQKFIHTIASRDVFSQHPLCLDPAGTSRPGLILLRALYKEVPTDFQNEVVARCGRLPVRNRADEYFALFPETGTPTFFDMDTHLARWFRQRYPLLKNIPSTYRKRDEVVAPAPQETPSPTTQSTSPPPVSLTDDDDREGLPPPPQPTRILHILPCGRRVFLRKFPGFGTESNNNQSALRQTDALLESMLQQSSGPNERPLRNPLNLVQTPLATTAEADRPVTRQEFDRLREQAAAMQSQMATLEENMNLLRWAFIRKRERRERREEPRREQRSD
ncbi:uncharacterized protein Triagg1_4127 [Trichoderma aggressivum f. europaeum]|uniref:Uncharacterized protein n=1 Tax=Trichoderma aggressivum f. europaeum TaxID=173218 RepID=A0AAE1IEJ5_9HYPO|nr:hypothetical protein Triagg1_4127 [Trichoderma aggressivum f. europaeum]